MNEGLVTAEVELESEDQEVIIPDWIDEEVTNVSKYTSSALSRLPYNMWKSTER
jgi:adenylate cyclase